ncbi:MAG: thiamine phosphate synthase [Pyrinomonadaceae bacterium]|nr:thiamine phosphate synthase [Pyrinomonadaceae bacterium]
MPAVRFELPKIYPITDRLISGVSHAEQAALLAAAGAGLIQVREKHLSSRGFFDEAKAAIAAAAEYGVPVIINDRVDLAMMLGAAGVHLGQEDVEPIAARRVLGENAVIGYSTHNIEQALAAIKMPVDYIAFGPIFPTSTKENPDPTVGLENLSEIRKAIGDFPLVAIGGITREKASDVFTAGADSIAVISDLISDPFSIEERFAQFTVKIC